MNGGAPRPSDAPMATTGPVDPRLARARVLLVGVGGRGCPVAMALADAGVGLLVLADDDRVEVHNLHRQLLYRESDRGRDKLDAARDALVARGVPAERIELCRGRLLPESALALTRRVDLVVEGSDDYGTKFLATDAGHLAGVPVVLGAVARWKGTAWAVAPGGRPCYRCLFEAPPTPAPDPARTGVLGPVPGITGALLADLTLRWLTGDAPTGGLFTFDGWRDRLRFVEVPPRDDCPLCGAHPRIAAIDAHRYRASRAEAPPGTAVGGANDPSSNDRFARQRRLVEVGDAGQGLIGALDVSVPDVAGAEIEREFLLRAGARGARIAGAPEPGFPHDAHFHFAASRALAAGAWRALTRIRAALEPAAG